MSCQTGWMVRFRMVSLAEPPIDQSDSQIIAKRKWVESVCHTCYELGHYL
jgi:hypothetical protein